MRTIVIGLGNPVLSDDAVGPHVVRRLSRQLEGRTDVEAVELYTGGIHLMEAMAGFDRAIVIDAMVSNAVPPGAIHRLSASEWPHSRNTSSSHDASLAVALEFGRMAGLRLPEEITALAVEAADVETLGEELTGEVGRAVPTVVSMVLEQLDGRSVAGGETA